jgi:hypothetical protein
MNSLLPLNAEGSKRGYCRTGHITEVKVWGALRPWSHLRIEATSKLVYSSSLSSATFNEALHRKTGIDASDIQVSLQ